MKKMMMAVVTIAAGLVFGGVNPLYIVPLDGSEKVVSRDGSKSASVKVYGRGEWRPGRVGQSLHAARHAYDQMTILYANGFDGLDARKGTIAFWLKPDFDDDDTEGRRILWMSSKKGNFTAYITKAKGSNARNRGEVSICVPRQIQVLFDKGFWTKDRWMHFAVTWDAAKDVAQVYVNGRLYKTTVRPGASKDATDDKATVGFSFGDGGTDRFKAVPGDCCYDDFRIYDSVLSSDEIYLLASGEQGVKMSVVALPGSEFSFAYSVTNRLDVQQQLLRLYDAKGGKVIVSASGPSGRLVFTGVSSAGETKSFDSADTLLLDNGYVLSVGNEVMLDDALQGRFDFSTPLGKIVRAEAVDGVKIQSASPRRFSPEPVSAFEAKADFYSYAGAERRVDGVRRAISLNALWRVREANDYLGAPPECPFEYLRVPGNHRSTLYIAKKFDRDGRLVPAEDLPRCNFQSDGPRNRTAWYERPFEVPAEGLGKGGRVWINFTDISANAARIYINGKMVRSFRRDWKFDMLLPYPVRIDVTDLLRREGGNVVTVYADRHFFKPNWKANVANGVDQTSPILNDVWLEFVPGKVAIANAQALPSVKESTVSLRARLDNPSAAKGAAEVKFVFSRDGKVEREFAEKVVLTGEASQKVSFSREWKDAVLWTMEDPQCYDMTVALSVGGEVSDTLPAAPFGFRELTVENGSFMLNGHHCRFRMFTNHIMVDRRPYLFASRQGAEQFVLHLKDLGYDSTRCNPHRDAAHVGMSEFYRACDRLGFSISLMMPQYTGQDRGEYEQVVERWYEAFGGHPSVMMWYTEFNDCCYAFDQDPSQLANTEYVPWRHSTRQARAWADVAMETMRRFDLSRELYQHAGGNKGSVYGSMNYQSYGTPLQEQEDWPAQWARGHKQPLMVVECGFPFIAQFDHFDNRKLGTFGAEHAARYFGDGVFALEKKAISIPPPGWVRKASMFGDEWTSSMTLLSKLHYERVVKAWRAYDVSAIGDFPGSTDVGRCYRTFDWHNAVRFTGGNPKASGLKIDSTMSWCHEMFTDLSDFTLRNSQYDSVKECFEPLLVFLAGRPGAFTEKDHAFFSGERFRKSIAVVNDHLYPVKLGYSWKLGDRAGNGEIEVAAGGIVFEPIELVAPEVLSRTDARLEVEVTREGRLVRRDTLALEFFPRHRQREFPRQARVGLYDPKGNTAKVLDAAGLKYRRVASVADAKDITLLVIGQRALGEREDSVLSAIEQSGMIDNGLSVLVFEQDAKAKFGGFMMTSPSYRDAFVRDAASPYLAGLCERDFHDWRGDSDAVLAFVVSDEKSPHYPRSKWKCGNGGIVSGNVIRKPSYGRFRTIVDSGFNLMFANLLEERKGRGRILYCQLDVTCRYGKDPAATTLVDNLLFELSKGYFTAGPVTVCYYGDDAGAEYLNRIGLAYDRLNARSLSMDCQFYEIVVLGPVNAGDKLLNPSQLIGKSGVIALPGAPLSSIPGQVKPLSWGTAYDFRINPPREEPMFEGITRADCYFRVAQDLKTVAGLVRWSSATEPAVVARHDYGIGKAAFIFAEWPHEMQGIWNDEKLSRVYNTVFSNMHLPLGKDHTVFAPSSWSCYIDKVDPYDVDAFHNW